MIQAPDWSDRYKKIKHFASLFNTDYTNNSWCVKIQLGEILYKDKQEKVVASVACPSDISIDCTEVWIQIGKEYPSIPMLDQYSDPMRMNDIDAINLVTRLTNMFTPGVIREFKDLFKIQDDSDNNDSDNDDE
jgi:hypothetical protein